mgnify:FL=1
MFKKKCNNCNGSISKKDNFCNSCGTKLKNSDDLGLFGKNDSTPGFEQLKLPKGLNLILNSLMKNLDKQFKDLDSEIDENRSQNNPNTKKSGVSISISTIPGKTPQVKINSFGNEQESKQIKNITKPTKKLPSKTINTSKLSKKEPISNIRRFADKIVYEIQLPGVKSMKDVSIVQFENSIEIKAITKDKAYIKLIPIGLPIMNYELEKGKLVLELDAKN